jgi:hypothetical protein
MGTGNEFPVDRIERLQPEEWPAEFIQADGDDGGDAAAFTAIALARQVGVAVVACAIGLIVVTLAALAINAAFARLAPFDVAAPAAVAGPANP